MKKGSLTLVFTLVGFLFSFGQTINCTDSIVHYNVSLPVEFCQGDSVNVVVLGSYDNYLWSTGDTTGEITINSTGEYWVQVSGDTCSQLVDTIQTIAHPLPVPEITANGPTEFCIGDSVDLTVGQGYSAVLWNSGTIIPTIRVTHQGCYVVTVLDTNGCIDSTDQCFEVIVHDPQPTIVESGDSLICTPPFSSYQWYNNDAPISGATEQVYCIEEFGYFYVEVIDENGCVGISGIVEMGGWKTLNCGVGLEQVRLDEFQITPNPTKDQVTLDLELTEPQSLNISLYNAFGQVVLTPMQMGEANSVIKKEIDLSSLPNGVYFLSLESGAERLVRAVVKQ